MVGGGGTNQRVLQDTHMIHRKRKRSWTVGKPTHRKDDRQEDDEQWWKKAQGTAVACMFEIYSERTPSRPCKQTWVYGGGHQQGQRKQQNDGSGIRSTRGATVNGDIHVRGGTQMETASRLLVCELQDNGVYRHGRGASLRSHILGQHSDGRCCMEPGIQAGNVLTPRVDI